MGAKNSKSPLFFEFISKYCSEEWLYLINNLIEIKKFKKGERIFSEGEKVSGVFFINKGKVKVVTSYDTSNDRILRFSNEGDLLGHRALTSEKYPISAIALTDVELTFITLDMFLKLMRANPDFSIYIVEFITKELHDAEDRMKNLIHNEVIVRLGVIICMLIDAYGYEGKSKKLAYTLSRSDMASFAGTSYESVIRNLTKLEELKLIKIVRKEIQVLSERELRKFISTPSRELK